jgi:hypothetical protein
VKGKEGYSPFFFPISILTLLVFFSFAKKKGRDSEAKKKASLFFFSFAKKKKAVKLPGSLKYI